MQLSDSDIVLLKIDVEDAEGGNVGDDDDDKIGVDTFDLSLKQIWVQVI